MLLLKASNCRFAIWKTTLTYQVSFREWITSDKCIENLRKQAKEASKASKTVEAIEKWRISRKGFKFSEESKLKISKSNSKPKPSGFSEKLNKHLQIDHLRQKLNKQLLLQQHGKESEK